MNKILRVIFAAVSAVALFSGCQETELPDPVLLELDRSNMKMTVGQSQKLYAVLKGSDEKRVWKSADASIALVDQSGLVTAVSAGKTVITVEAGKASKECNVEVVDFKADALEWNDDIVDHTLIVPAGDKYQLQAKFYKAGEKVNDLAFPMYTVSEAVPSRTGETVATIDQEGLITTSAPGKAVVTVSGAGLTKSFTLLVKEVTLSAANLNVFVQETAQLSVSVLPEMLPEAEKAVEWYTSDSEYVTVDAQGAVKGLKPTTEPVEVSAVVKNMSVVCAVTVSEFKAHSVAFANLNDVVRKNNGKYEIYIGENPVVLTSVFSDAAGNNVTDRVINKAYSSSDNSVATISSNGELAPVAPGKTTITVSGAGVQATFELNVYQGVEELQINPAGTKVAYEGSEPFTIAATVLPETASVKTVTFVSDKPEVASVDPKTGVVTIGTEGVAKVTVTTEGYKKPVKGSDGNYVYETLSATLIVNVSKQSSTPASVTVTSENVVDGTLVIQKGSVAQLSAVTEPAGFDGTYSWMVTDDIISVDQTGKLTALAVGNSVVAVVAASDSWGTAMGELPVRVTGINPTAIEIVNGSSLTAAVNETPLVLEARATAPANADFGGVNWYSSDENIVKVDKNGRLTYLGVGKAVVTAKAKTWDGAEELSNVSAQFSLDILNAEVTDFDIAVKEGGIYKDGIYYLEKGAQMTLKCATIPIGTIPNTIAWKSDNSSVATINADGVVNGVEFFDDQGTDAVITCVVDGKLERSMTIRVIMQQPTDIQVTLPGRSLKVDEKWNLNPRVIPEFLGYYASPAFGVPVTDGGVFSTSTPGTYYVGFYVSNSQAVSILNTLQRQFVVTVEPYWVESVSIPATADMEVGSSMSFAPSFTSDVAGVEPTYKDVKWESQDPSIASIDEHTGEITAHKAGTVKITVTTNNDWSVPGGTAQKSAICTLTVKESGLALNIGDYYYSDGTWSSQLDASKTVIGVVFAKVNAASSDLRMAADKPECTHGLVVSTAEYTSAYNQARSWSLRDAEGWLYDNGYTQYKETTKPVGYSNTKGFLALNAAQVQSYGYTIDFALFGAESPVRKHRSSVAVPAAATDWYLPSFKEMQLLFEAKNVINPIIESLSGTKVGAEYPFQYWCSTSDYDSIGVRAVTMNNGQWMTTGKTESSVLPVRVILAF